MRNIVKASCNLSFVLLLSFLISSACQSSVLPQGVIVYKRSGGFAGLDDTLTIQLNGQATLIRHNQTTTLQLDSSKTQSLNQLLSASNFASLSSNYSAGGNDLITYSITFNGKTVTSTDTAIPQSLAPVIDALNALVDGSP